MTDFSNELPEELPEVSTNKKEYELIPKGAYLCAIIECVKKDTKKGGVMLSLKYKIIEGDFEGRQFYSNINIKNDSEKAQLIGLSKVAEIQNAIDTTFTDTDHCLNIPICVHVIQTRGSDGYPPRNDAAMVLPVGEMTKNVNKISSESSSFIDL